MQFGPRKESASRRASLQRVLVLGAAILVMGSVLGACGGEEPSSAPACPSAEYPAAGALNITDGTVEWLVCSPDEASRTVIGASDDVVLIEENGSAGLRTIAFDAADGSERWSHRTADTPIPPGPFDGKGIVVLATDDRGALALVGVDAVTGQEKWRVESSEAPLAHSATVAVVWNVADPGAGQQLRGIGLRGIDRVTGDELWVSDTPLSDESGVCCKNSPAAVLGDVLAVPTGATVTAIDMRTGATLWKAPQLDHPTAADGLFVGTRETSGTPGTNGPPPAPPAITAIDAASGQERWTAPGRPSYGGAFAVGDGVIVVESGGPDLIAYKLSSGDERWRATRTVHIEPQLINGKSLVMLWEGELSVLSATDGATIWSATQPFGSPLMNNLGSNGASVFVAINSVPWTD